MPASTGLNRLTGAPLSDFDHVVQSVIVIWTTPIGTRVRRRTFGSLLDILLGRKNLTPDVLALFNFLLIAPVEMWEPRFRITRIVYPDTTNGPDGARVGKFGMRVMGEYRPNALTGDLTVAGNREFVL